MDALRIAELARRLTLLSEFPQYLTCNRAELIAHVLDAPAPLGELDCALLLSTQEIDRVCSHAVQRLGEQSSKPLLDVLGMMDAERVVAMYLTLPADRRHRVAACDPTWSYYISTRPPEAETVVAFAAAFAELERANNPRNYAKQSLSSVLAHAAEEVRDGVSVTDVLRAFANALDPQP